jgi:hypothetical protein
MRSSSSAQAAGRKQGTKKPQRLQLVLAPNDMAVNFHFQNMMSITPLANSPEQATHVKGTAPFETGTTEGDTPLPLGSCLLTMTMRRGTRWARGSGRPS